MSVSAAAIALGIMGSVAAAPISGSKSTTKPAPKPAVSKKPDAPKLSKWQQHVQDMLKASAPGDEYFGRMKMSYLGINNTFHDDLIRAGAYTTDPKIISRIQFADDALTAWSRKYPNDPQLARSYFLAFQMYRKVWVQTYQDKAWIYAHRVIEKWPASFFGKALKKDLAIGFTEHYFATPEMCADIAPPSTGTPNPKATATPTPTPSPSPSPAPTQQPGGPKTEILPAPCITPTPSPTPIPSAIPFPLPTGSIIPSPSPNPRGIPGATAVPSPGAAPPLPIPSPTPTPRPTHHP